MFVLAESMDSWFFLSFSPLNGVSVGGLKRGEEPSGECPPPDSDLSQWELFVTKTIRIRRSQASPNFHVRSSLTRHNLAEQQGVAYAKTVAEAMDLKLDADNPADREKLRRAVLDLVAGRKMPKQKGQG